MWLGLGVGGRRNRSLTTFRTDRGLQTAGEVRGMASGGGGVRAGGAAVSCMPTCIMTNVGAVAQKCSFVCSI